eukprot:COSAG01_NODE_5211_length_4407_cov_21.587279_1_plen_331_part_00
MEDLKQHQAWQRDQVEGHTPAEATLVVEAAAALHARYFNSLAAHGVDWLRPFAGSAEYMRYNKAEGQKYLPSFAATVREYGYGASDGSDGPIIESMQLFVDNLEQFYTYWRPVDEGGVTPSTLCHGDLRADNIFFTGDEAAGTLGVIPIDFQLARAAPGETDLAYFLSMSLTTETRRACELRLLRAYWVQLCTSPSGGVSADEYPFELCLHNFQLGLVRPCSPTLVCLQAMNVGLGVLLRQVYTLRTWVIAGQLNGNLIEHGGERGRRLLDSMYARAFATFADWNVKPALEALLRRGGARRPSAMEARAVLPDRIRRALQAEPGPGGAKL